MIEKKWISNTLIFIGYSLILFLFIQVNQMLSFDEQPGPYFIFMHNLGMPFLFIPILMSFATFIISIIMKIKAKENIIIITINIFGIFILIFISVLYVPFFLSELFPF